MTRRSRTLLAAALFVCLAPLALADSKDESPPEPDPARPAIGDWTGQVSWGHPLVSYAWRIDADGAFSSGRLGRGLDGGGVWSANGAHVTLKYEDGFRYDGEVQDDVYSGTAYLANGRVFGGFSMSRNVKRPDQSDPSDTP